MQKSSSSPVISSRTLSSRALDGPELCSWSIRGGGETEDTLLSTPRNDPAGWKETKIRGDRSRQVEVIWQSGQERGKYT